MARCVLPMLTVVLSMSIFSPSAKGDVSLVQLTAANVDLFLDSDARRHVTTGDVILRSDQLAVAVLTQSTKGEPQRAGQLVVLSQNARGTWAPFGLVAAGPGEVWSEPEAGQNNKVAMVRLHRREREWRAELTYQVRSGVPWVEVSTKIINLQPDRALELPVVDRIVAITGAEVTSADGTSLTLAGPQSISAGIVCSSGESVAEKGEVGWNICAVSGDPMPGLLRRASARMVSFGFGGVSLMPLEASRDWARGIRDREHWHRLDEKQSREVERRIVIGPSASLDALMAAAKGAGADRSPPGAGSAPAQQPSAIVGHARSEAPVVTPPSPAPPRQLAPKAEPAPPRPEKAPMRLTGRLRKSPPIPPAVAPAPVNPSGKKAAAPSSEFDDAGLSPTIDAIEDLPPPVE